jgi:uncharacterized DUF497 family protein
MFYGFRWIGWNISKVERHGLTISSVEYVVNHARRPFPKPIGNDKWLVIGPTRGGRIVQVIYLINEEDTLFVIHARPLTPKERLWHRRRR